jgi:TonB family protein
LGTSPKLQIQPEVQLSAGDAPAEQRLYLRRRVVKPLPIELLPGKGVWLHDIGEGGLSVSGTSRLQLGANTFLNFQFPEANTLIDAAGVVAWCDESGHAGVRFTRIKPDSTAALKRWLKSDAIAMVASSPAATPNLATSAPEREQSLVEVELLRNLIAAQKLDKSSALDMIVELMSELTRANGAAIALLEGADVICRARIGNAPDVGVKLSLDSKLSGECFLTGNIVQLNDSENDPRVDPAVCRALNFRSVLIIPIFSAGQVIGICEVLSPQPANFQGGDVLVVSALAELVASLDSRQETETIEPTAEEIVERPSTNEVISAVDEQTVLDEIMALAEPLPDAEPILLEQLLELSVPEIPEFEASAPVPLPQPVAAQHQPAQTAVVATTARREPKAKPKQEISTTLLVAVAGACILVTAGVAEYVHLARAKQMTPTSATAVTSTIATVPAAAAPDAGNAKLGGESAEAKTSEPAPAKVSVAAKPSAKTVKTEEDSAAGEDAIVLTPSGRQALAESRTETSAPNAPSIASLSGNATAIPLVANLPPASAPRLSGPINISRGVSGGKLIHRVAPSYPDLARRAGVSGTVVLSAVVSKDGKVTKLKLVKGSQLLASEAMRAAGQWRYSPFVLDGKPIEVETQIVMDFKR